MEANDCTEHTVMLGPKQGKYLGKYDNDYEKGNTRFFSPC